MKLSGMCQLGWGTLCFINHKAIYLKKKPHKLFQLSLYEYKLHMCLFSQFIKQHACATYQTFIILVINYIYSIYWLDHIFVINANLIKGLINHTLQTVC